MGSGSVGVAATRNQRDFLGNDLCTEAIDIARKRLQDLGAIEGLTAKRGERESQLGLTL